MPFHGHLTFRASEDTVPALRMWPLLPSLLRAPRPAQAQENILAATVLSLSSSAPLPGGRQPAGEKVWSVRAAGP